MTIVEITLEYERLAKLHPEKTVDQIGKMVCKNLKIGTISSHSPMPPDAKLWSVGAIKVVSLSGELELETFIEEIDEN